MSNQKELERVDFTVLGSEYNSLAARTTHQTFEGISKCVRAWSIFGLFRGLAEKGEVLRIPLFGRHTVVRGPRSDDSIEEDAASTRKLADQVDP